MQCLAIGVFASILPRIRIAILPPMRASKLPGIRAGGHLARKPTYAGVAKQCGQSRTLIQWQLTAGQRASPIFIIFVGNTLVAVVAGIFLAATKI
jgi:hypothetical protein